MKRFILTGAPGSGKTAIIRRLELEGFSVVEEAATDVIATAQLRGIAEPWKDQSFIDEIAMLQHDRQLSASHEQVGIQFHDRSAICTLALATYLGFSISTALASELERIRNEAVFVKQVFLIRNLGFITNTEARRISFEETLRFEKIHEETYRTHGFDLIEIAPGPVEERVTRINSLASMQHDRIAPSKPYL
ncbi:MAG: AAA family ATPase [Acidobacteria bacterium]|nr:AAA family ATPase [Acidobacteriota bacterium]